MTLSQANTGGEEASQTVDSVFSSRYEQSPVPKWRLPLKEMPKEAAYQTISDELMLDGNPRLDLASFCTTWMEPECDKLITQALSKNYIDMDEYPITTELQDRCLNMIAHLFHAPLDDGVQAIGAGTVGSSEAVMLGGLAMKRKWQLQRKAAGKPYDKPNFVCGANVHVVWEKFASYFEVELRDVKLREDFYVMDPEKAVELVDENTILVCTTFGSTYNGQFEDVKKLNDLLDKKNTENGWNVGIHVDAASGGFVAPFAYPDIEWDFRLKWVKSINVSGHKYGLVYPGIGWVIWRSQEELPEELVFHINYLGTDQPTFTLNFSKGTDDISHNPSPHFRAMAALKKWKWQLHMFEKRLPSCSHSDMLGGGIAGASQVIAQYYQMIRLGYQGYKKVISNCVANAKKLADAISSLGKFKLISKPVGVPLVAFTLLDDSAYDEHDIADGLKRYGWTVPAYTMAPNAQNVTLLRVVVREDFSTGLVERLVTDIKRVLKILETEPAKKLERAAEPAKEGQKKSMGKQRREDAKKAHKDSMSVFDKEHNKLGHFNVHKTHGLHKSNGVC